MATRIIPDERIRKLNDKQSAEGRFVIYWMQQSQRAEENHALEFAIRRANELQTGLLVLFAVTDDYPDANLRHYRFMLEGLQEVSRTLRRRKIPLVVRLGDPPATVIKLASDAAEIVCDRGYLRHQKQWRKEVAQQAGCRVWQVETDVIVPVEVASSKQEYAARTIRPKLNNVADEWMSELATTPLDSNSLDLSVEGIDLSDIDSVLDEMSIDRSVEPIAAFEGGTARAKQRLRDFLEDSLSQYADRTSVIDPHVSQLSPYLHFGQISPSSIARAVESSKGHPTDSKESFLEELLVRRELTSNFVHYQSDYDNLNCLPDWASDTLSKHESDEREFHYTATELDQAETHDPAWNAAMLEMKHGGYLHNHLRMYWGKKIIEWTNTVEHAHRTALELNNRYFLDGRDCNSFANIAWLFGLHDRAHQERAIFGKVRYMSAGGLKRKINVDQYIRHVSDRLGVRVHGFDDGRNDDS